MKKTFKVTNANGVSASADIIVQLNYRTESKQVHNRGTHEEEVKRISFHRVVGQHVGTETKIYSDDFQNENDVFKHIKIIEEDMTTYLTNVINTLPEKTIVEKLKAQGFHE
jgi:hypothetical protein